MTRLVLLFVPRILLAVLVSLRPSGVFAHVRAFIDVDYVLTGCNSNKTSTKGKKRPYPRAGRWRWTAVPSLQRRRGKGMKMTLYVGSASTAAPPTITRLSSVTDVTLRFIR